MTSNRCRCTTNNSTQTGYNDDAMVDGMVDASLTRVTKSYLLVDAIIDIMVHPMIEELPPSVRNISAERCYLVPGTSVLCTYLLCTSLYRDTRLGVRACVMPYSIQLRRRCSLDVSIPDCPGCFMRPMLCWVRHLYLALFSTRLIPSEVPKG